MLVTGTGKISAIQLLGSYPSLVNKQDSKVRVTFHDMSLAFTWTLLCLNWYIKLIWTLLRLSLFKLTYKIVYRWRTFIQLYCIKHVCSFVQIIIVVLCRLNCVSDRYTSWKTSVFIFNSLEKNNWKSCLQLYEQTQEIWWCEWHGQKWADHYFSLVTPAYSA